MIIDIHSHIGNILYPGGGDLIFRAEIPFPASSGLQKVYERTLFRETRAARIINKLDPMLSVRAERRRNFSATLENFRASLLGTGIARCVCLPIAPNNTFADVLAAKAADARIIAFTSPDFSVPNTVELLARDLPLAAGVKIHPILQEVEADAKRVMEAVGAVSARAPEKPVLLHCGRSLYYTPREGKRRFRDFASVVRTERLIRAFPGVKFIVGHAGLDEVGEAIALLPKYKNVSVDTSFQSPEVIRALVSAFGGDRVLFGSDWPYGLRLPAIAAVREACAGDKALQRAIFYENAAGLLGESLQK